MRRLASVALIFFFAALASTRAARAQFTQPDAEELKMTAESKASEAAAVYLDREQIIDDRNHLVTFYARIEVLTEKGKALATVTLPYERGVDTVTEIDGRTVHSDGAVIPLTELTIRSRCCT